MRLAHLKLVLLLSIGLLAVPGTPYGSGLELIVEPSEHELVVREPVRFRVALRNASSAPINVIEVKKLDSDMQYAVMEITTPDGEVQIRQSSWSHTYEVRNPNYEGEALEPGQEIVFFVYPSVSGRLDERGLDPITFPKAGRYTVRLIYEVPRVFTWLRANAPSRVESEPVILTFRAPAPDEQRILDALWGDAASWPMRAEVLPSRYSGVAALHEVIQEYPAHPLIRHVRLRLANALSIDENDAAMTELEQLQSVDPSFREFEVAMLLAFNLRSLDRNQSGAAVLDALLLGDPSLKSCYRFMWEWFACHHEKSFRSHNPVTQWRKNRLMGVKDPEKQIIFDDDDDETDD